MGVVRYGTSSFSEKSWVGPFYPPGTPPGEFLTVYAERFDTVEVDATYYRVPAERTVRGWERKVPEGFLLAAKFPRSIVHAGSGPRPDGERVLVPEAVAEDTDAFLERMSLLGEKCGPLLLQFPYFNRSAFPDAEPFLERLDRFLDELPADFRYAVEVRNEKWIDEPLLACLRRHGAALVLVDLHYMPHPERLAREMDVVTADFSYARLIGNRKAVEEETDTFDEIVIDQSERLERWATLLRELSERVPETLVYANNHYAGHAPATIRDLAERVAAGS